MSKLKFQIEWHWAFVIRILKLVIHYDDSSP
jgi:hypothetical protein